MQSERKTTLPMIGPLDAFETTEDWDNRADLGGGEPSSMLAAYLTSLPQSKNQCKHFITLNEWGRVAVLNALAWFVVNQAGSP
jgi:hypothetical protein